MENSFESRMNEFARQALETAQRAGISPAEATVSSSESFSVRVRAGKLEDYKVCDRFHLTLRGAWQGRIGTAGTQAMDDESLQMLIQGVKESAELIETDEQDDILPPDAQYSAVCNYSEDAANISAGDKIALAMRIDARLAAGDALPGRCLEGSLMALKGCLSPLNPAKVSNSSRIVSIITRLSGG